MRRFNALLPGLYFLPSTLFSLRRYSSVLQEETSTTTYAAEFPLEPTGSQRVSPSDSLIGTDDNTASSWDLPVDTESHAQPLSDIRSWDDSPRDGANAVPGGTLYTATSDALSENVVDISQRPILDNTDRAEVNAVLYLCEELSQMKQTVLANFVRTKRKARTVPIDTLLTRPGTNECTKLVLELLQHAEQESKGNFGFSNIQKKVGVIEEETKLAMKSREWTDRSLEAVHLEYACQKSIRSDTVQHSAEQTIKRHGRLSRKLCQRLSKVVFEEYDAVSLAAVEGRVSHDREESVAIVKNTPLRELMSIFSAFLARNLMEVGNVAFLSSNTSIMENLVQEQLYQPPVSEDSLAALRRMMGLLDSIEEEVISRTAAECGLTATHQASGGTHNVSQLIPAIERFKKEVVRLDAAKDVPDFIVDLAVQFGQWEQLVRNDIPALANAPNIVFDVILIGVASVRLMKLLAPHASPEEQTSASKVHSQMLDYVLRLHFEENAQGIIEALNTYANVHTDQSRIDRRMFESIATHHLSAVGVDAGVPPNERVALVLHECVNLVSKAPRLCGLHTMLVNLSTEMVFHLRFRAVYKQMPTHQRTEVNKQTKKANQFYGRTSKIWKILLHHEAEYSLTPVPTRAVCFMVTIFLHLLTNNKSLMKDGWSPNLTDSTLILYRPVNGADEFALLTLMGGSSAVDIKLAHPPQLEHKSWSESKDGQGLYQLIPSKPLMSSMSDVFLKTKPPMLQALDAVSKVPWRISRYILYVQEMMLKEGFGFHKIMPSFHPLNHMSLPTGFTPSPTLQAGPEARLDIRHLFNQATQAHYEKQRMEDRKALRQIHSNRQHYLLAMRTARNLVNKDKVFFPHKLDFRGRMYPIVGRLAHSGSDPFRALLDFADPVPLGEHGLFWLKVHLANKMGHNKLSFDERVAYVDQHIEDVVQSAESPTGGERWWHQADEPLQALSACHEIANALKYSGPTKDFPSTLPIHIDGSCNGLQHYSAIGRDEHGGRLVNLVPNERPQDVYNGVLAEIIKVVKKDAANDNDIAQRCLGSGKHLDKNHLKRKTIKRAVMTQVYGVTYYGMSQMIAGELENQNNQHNLWTRTMITEMSAYLRDKLVESLGVTFARAQRARAWLDDTTRLIWQTQPHGLQSCFQWVTPLGLIVRQPYVHGAAATVFTQMGPVRIDTGVIAYASRSQLTALPPNLIHSLDACHLAMTALEMDRLGLPMVAVHDSFWSHAANLPTLSKVLRKEFHALYANYDPLWEMKEQWEEQFYIDLKRHGVRLSDPPARGDLDITQVLDSQYFFA